MSGTLTARELRRRIGVKYGKLGDAVLMPEHLVMFEVPVDGRPRWDGDTKGTRQRIDAVAVGMWGRTRHLIHGFEIKCSRADLIIELRDLSKSAAGVAMCDTWSLVLADADLLRPDDLIPDGWGVLAARGRGLTVLRKPVEREGVRDGRIIAGLLQAAARTHGACRGLARVGYVALSRYEHEKAENQRLAAEVFQLRVRNRDLEVAQTAPGPWTPEPSPVSRETGSVHPNAEQEQQHDHENQDEQQ